MKIIFSKDQMKSIINIFHTKARLDTRLPKFRAGGQGPYLRSLDYLDSESGVQEIKS